MQTNDDFQAVKARIDIQSEITQRTGLAAKKIGKDIDLEKCPFCSGHNCFRINPAEGLYNCFQCPGGGDIFTFVEKLKGCSKREALEDVAASCGYELTPAPGKASKEDPREKEQDAIQAIREVAAEYCHEKLLLNENALRHQTRTRGHSLAILKEKKVGLTDGELHEELARRDFTQEQRLKSGLVKIRDGREQDYFVKGLFIYPHLTISGQVGHFTIKDPRKKLQYQFPNEFKDPGCSFFNMRAFKDNDTIIVVEGENDLLSVAGRGGYQNVVACCGQISKEQIDYLVKSAPGKTIVVCFDNDKAGKGYEEKIRTAFKDLCLPPKLEKIIKAPRANLRIIRFDEKYNDIDDYMKSKKAGNRTVTDLLNNSEPVLMPLKSIIITYRTWCKEQDRPKNSNEMGEIIFDCLNIMGKFFVVGDECRIFFKRKIYRIGNDQAFKSILYEEFGLNYAYSETKQIVEVVLAKAYSQGKHTTVPGSIHGDLENSTIYFNLHNDRSEIVKLSPGKVEILQNGTNHEGILLDDSPKMKPLEFFPDADIKLAMKVLSDFIFQNLTCSSSNRFFVLCTLFNILLIPFTKARGIVKFSGNSGSAKTAAAALVTIVVFGEDSVTTGSTASDFTEATRSLITIADNLENSDISGDKKMFLLTAATGITRQKRKGGTDSENVYERSQTQVIVTAVEPFVENELIQRTNDIEFSKKYRNTNYLEAKAVESKIIPNRNLIFSAFFKILTFNVLPGFKEKRAKTLKMLRDDYPAHSKERLNELYSCLFILCGELLKYIPHPEHDNSRMTNDQKARAVLNDWIRYQDARSKAISEGTNPILYSLEVLLREFQKNETAFEGIYNIEADASKNEAGEYVEVRFICTTGGLFSAFEILSKNRGVSRYYKSPSQLGARIKDSIEVLEENNWLFFHRKTATQGVRRHWFVKMFDMDGLIRPK
jgi:5S rRNA maturation endonuclease (ribonuclease M5)